MLFPDVDRVHVEGQNVLAELRRKQINTHFKLVADRTSKEMVDVFLGDVGKALEKVQKEIRSIVDLPHSVYVSKTGELEQIRNNEKKLTYVRDQILEQTKQ